MKYRLMLKRVDCQECEKEQLEWYGKHDGMLMVRCRNCGVQYCLDTADFEFEVVEDRWG